MNREQRRHAPNGVGLHLLPQMAAQAQPPAGPVFNVGPLMNDVQLVAYLAAARHGTAAEAVEWALAVVALAVARTPELPGMIAAAAEKNPPPAAG